MTEMSQEDRRSTKILHTCPTCVVCGVTSAFELPGTQVDRWKAGQHIQDAFPQLTDNGRELLISGTHPDCWDELFGDDDEEEGNDRRALVLTPLIKNKDNRGEGVVVGVRFAEWQPGKSYEFLSGNLTLRDKEGKVMSTMIEVVPTSEAITLWCSEEFNIYGGWDNQPAMDVMAQFDEWKMIPGHGPSWRLGGPIVVTGPADAQGETTGLSNEVTAKLVEILRCKHPDDLLGPYPARWQQLV